MREVVFSIFHQNCWGSKTSSRFPEAYIKLLSVPVFQRRSGPQSTFSALWNLKGSDKAQSDEMVEYVKGLPSTVKFDAVEKKHGSVNALMSIKTPSLVMDAVIENNCHMTRPLVVSEGLERWSVVTEDVRNVKGLLSDLAKWEK